MARTEVPALSRAVPQDGNELNSMENFKTVEQTNTKIYFSLLVRGEKMRYARLRGRESPPPMISDFVTFWIARFGSLISDY
jgi:hypothetical protein